jgi:acyl-CoA dehydrogenase
MSEFLEPFDRMLEALCDPAAVRAVEAGKPIAAMWQGVAESGFLEALVPADHGGAGLSLADVHPLWQALGRRAVPLPVGDTMIARRLLAVAGVACPEGPIAIAEIVAAETVLCFGGVATHALVETEGRLHLVALGTLAPTGIEGSTAARFRHDMLTGNGIAPAPVGGLRALAALLRASLIAGAADRLMAMTVAYANERTQFGKPIGRQQALQQNLAVMAEDAVAVRIASQLGCAGAFPPSLAAAATAKSVASAAAVRIAATAHAVHGAIGISAEHDLQLFTRRLQEWRLADGSESYWNRKLGALRLAVAASSMDFIRTDMAAL